MSRKRDEVVERYITPDGICFDDKDEATAHTKTIAIKGTLSQKETKVQPVYYKETYY